METIRPSSDLRNHYSEIAKYELDLLKIMAETEEDINAGRVAPMQDTFDDIRKSLMEKNTNAS